MRRFEAKPAIAEDSDEDAAPPHHDGGSESDGEPQHGANGDEVRFLRHETGAISRHAVIAGIARSAHPPRLQADPPGRTFWT